MKLNFLFKIRVLVEFIWPLFLFIILVWVRTRGLESYERHCHFTTRTLPSGGFIPFFQNYICELNQSCSQIPREQTNPNLNSSSVNGLNNLTLLTDDFLVFINRPDISETSKQIFHFITHASSLTPLIRNSSASTYFQSTLSSITNNLTETFQSLNLSLLTDKQEQFNNKSVIDILSDSSLNLDALNLTSILNANIPNRNNAINDIFPTLLGLLLSDPLNNVITNTTLSNFDNADWIRQQQKCNSTLESTSTTPLLVSKTPNDTVVLNKIICEYLNDSQLEQVFSVIINQINYEQVIGNFLETATAAATNTSSDNSLASLLINSLSNNLTSSTELLQSLNYLVNQFQMDNGERNVTQFIQVVSELRRNGIATTVCGDSKLSIFSLFTNMSFTFGLSDGNNSYNFDYDNATLSEQEYDDNFATNSDINKQINDTNVNRFINLFVQPKPEHVDLAKRKNNTSKVNDLIIRDTDMLKQIENIFKAQRENNKKVDSSSQQPQSEQQQQQQQNSKIDGKRDYIFIDNENPDENQIYLLLKLFNGLTKLNETECPFIQSSNYSNLNDSFNENILKKSKSNGCFCKTITGIFRMTSSEMAFIYKRISPIITGKIVYSPDTPLVRQLLKEANATFENVEKIINIIGTIADVMNKTMDRTGN
jgi:hypothetical protein